MLMVSMVSCQKGPTRHAYAWQIGSFWQDTLGMWNIAIKLSLYGMYSRAFVISLYMHTIA